MRRTFYHVWSIAILSVSVLIFCVTLFLVVGQNRLPEVTLALTPDNGEARAGKTLSVGVYFRGRDAGQVNAADIRLKYDPRALKLISATEGPFFNQPVRVRWSQESGRFALTANPTVEQSENSDLSVLRLEFQVLRKGETEISFDPESKAYVSGKGGTNPQPNAGIYKIN